jgi:hypothetical protein
MKIGFLLRSREITEEMGILFSWCQNFSVRRITAEFVLRQVAVELLCVRSWRGLFRHPLVLSTNMTGDETWIQGYDPKTRHQFTQWKCAAPLRLKEERVFPCAVYSLLILFVPELMELCTGGLSERDTLDKIFGKILVQKWRSAEVFPVTVNI